MTHDDSRETDSWGRLPGEERRLRIVLAWIAWGRLHCLCTAESEAHRPLHITTLWDNALYGFALKLEGYYEGIWFVRLLDATEIFDVVYLPWSCERRSRSALKLTDGRDDDVRAEWLGTVQAFFEYRGLLPVAPRE